MFYCYLYFVEKQRCQYGHQALYSGDITQSDDGCNICVCHEGEIICTHMLCYKGYGKFSSFWYCQIWKSEKVKWHDSPIVKTDAALTKYKKWFIKRQMIDENFETYRNCFMYVCYRTHVRRIWYSMLFKGGLRALSVVYPEARRFAV